MITWPGGSKTLGDQMVDRRHQLPWRHDLCPEEKPGFFFLNYYLLLRDHFIKAFQCVQIRGRYEGNQIVIPASPQGWFGWSKSHTPRSLSRSFPKSCLVEETPRSREQRACGRRGCSSLWKDRKRGVLLHGPSYDGHLCSVVSLNILCCRVGWVSLAHNARDQECDMFWVSRLFVCTWWILGWDPSLSRECLFLILSFFT